MFDFEYLWQADRLSLIGPYLGRGDSRTAYECALDRSLVIKIMRPDAYKDDAADNYLEWRFWIASSDCFRQWLAPIVWLSGDHTAMAMARTAAVESGQVVEFPTMFFDLHARNMGMLDGRAVIHDYANLMDRAGICYVRQDQWPMQHHVVGTPSELDRA